MYVHDDYRRLKAPMVYVDALPDATESFPDHDLPGLEHSVRRAVRRLAPRVLAARVTHLHAHFATSAATTARELGRRLSLPYSVTAHAKDIFHESVSSEALRTVIRDAAFLVTVSDYNAAYLHQGTARALTTPIHRIYNGIDTVAIGPESTARESTTSVLAVGRLVEKKGFDVFVDAVAALGARIPTLTATLVGTGRCEEDLRGRVKARGLSGRLTLPGPLSQAAVMTAMRTHQVLAVPCVVAPDGDRDGLPTVIVEAMAIGLPVVATGVTGIPEVVQHGRTGLIVPERDPAALAAAIEVLIRPHGPRHQLIAAARRLIEEQFDITRNVRQLADRFVESSAMGIHHSPAAANAARGNA